MEQQENAFLNYAKNLAPIYWLLVLDVSSLTSLKDQQLGFKIGEIANELSYRSNQDLDKKVKEEISILLSLYLAMSRALNDKV